MGATITTTVSDVGTVPNLARKARRDERRLAERQVTVIPTSVPEYAYTECHSAVASYLTACSCVGARPTVVTTCAPIASTTITVTSTATATATATVTVSTTSTVDVVTTATQVVSVTILTTTEVFASVTETNSATVTATSLSTTTLVETDTSLVTTTVTLDSTITLTTYPTTVIPVTVPATQLTTATAHVTTTVSFTMIETVLATKTVTTFDTVTQTTTAVQTVSDVASGVHFYLQNSASGQYLYLNAAPGTSFDCGGYTKIFTSSTQKSVFTLDSTGQWAGVGYTGSNGDEMVIRGTSPYTSSGASLACYPASTGYYPTTCSINGATGVFTCVSGPSTAWGFVVPGDNPNPQLLFTTGTGTEVLAIPV